jgi:hypothetical protein
VCAVVNGQCENGCAWMRLSDVHARRLWGRQGTSIQAGCCSQLHACAVWCVACLRWVRAVTPCLPACLPACLPVCLSRPRLLSSVC